MTVNKIYLEGWRNFKSSEVQFAPGVNVIAGRNAQGKTNLLEAVYYLAVGKSFRSAYDKELIRLADDTAYVRAEIESQGRDQILEARLARSRRRELFANGVKLKKAAELTGRLSVVLFNPEDLDMIRSGAAARRRLLDHSLCQLRPRYAAALSEFNKLYAHKTRILRDYHKKPSLLDLLDDFNLRLAHEGAVMIYYRAAFIELLAKKAAVNHHEFSNTEEILEIQYKTVTGVNPYAEGQKSPQDLLPALLEHQQSHREAEIRSGQCLSGAHRDDFEIIINDLPARKFASQGQARTAAVSIKLAERDIHHEDSGEIPVLLLDDVLSELDAARQDFILNRIKQGQVLITSCNETDRVESGEVITVENGMVIT
ncbi:MAG: DNA replication/repair protein RecF [Oscillospiraceae bacterium]|nr:DNA replication/repair protein RecF [Oscillospiraceae bacterium]